MVGDILGLHPGGSQRRTCSGASQQAECSGWKQLYNMTQDFSKQKGKRDGKSLHQGRVRSAEHHVEDYQLHNGWGWKGHLEVILSKPLLKEGHLEPVAQASEKFGGIKGTILG